MDLQNIEHLNDYAQPLMRIERLAKQAHELCLENKFPEACEVAMQIAAEGRILKHVLIIMEERANHGRTKEVQAGTQHLHRGDGAAH